MNLAPAQKKVNKAGAKVRTKGDRLPLKSSF